MEAARLLGAPLRGASARVALPLARPAMAAGVALALMETLADFGVASYFGIQTFSAGIYKAWLAMDNRIAAAQLATVLLAVVACCWRWSMRAQRACASPAPDGPGRRPRPAGAAGRRTGRFAVAVCTCPCSWGSCCRWLFMLRPLVPRTGACCPGTASSAGPEQRAAGRDQRGARGADARCCSQLRCGGAGGSRAPWCSLAGLGYAVPGAVIVVGLLLPVGWLQQAAPQATTGYWVTGHGARHRLGLPRALHVGGAAVGAERLRAHPGQPGRLRAHAGRRPPGLLARVHWPLLRRSVAAAGLLVFVDVMKELPATLVLRPFNTDTLAVVAYQLARDERLGEAALPSLALVLVGLVPVMLLSRTLRRSSPFRSVAGCGA
jgi:iron(III) transport system permease protein